MLPYLPKVSHLAQAQFENKKIKLFIIKRSSLALVLLLLVRESMTQILVHRIMIMLNTFQFLYNPCPPPLQNI